MNLVTDRTVDDVREGTAKGVYNAEDLNRVENATGLIAGKLTSAGYPTTVTLFTDWAKEDYPWIDEMNRYLDNVKLCVANFGKKPETPELPSSMSFLTYIGANTIEKTLLDIDELLDNLAKTLRYSGTFYAGDISGLRGNID